MTDVTLWVVRASPTAAEFKLMAAAFSRDEGAQAIVTILDREPMGAIAELAAEQLSADQIATLDLRPGEVIEFSRGMTLGRRA